jgi:hypothetical protein
MCENVPIEPTHEELKQALKAFKKRLKLKQLDDESRLGKNPATGGRASGIYAITPPDQFPKTCWDELVKQGKLKKAGPGFYELVSDVRGGA